MSFGHPPGVTLIAAPFHRCYPVTFISETSHPISQTFVEIVSHVSKFFLPPQLYSFA